MEEDDHHGQPAAPAVRDHVEVRRRAGRVLLDALAQSGAQDAAHTALAATRTRGATIFSQPGDFGSARELAELTQQLDEIAERLQTGRDGLRAAEAELGSAPRWSLTRCRGLTNAIAAHQEALTNDGETLTRVVAALVELAPAAAPLPPATASAPTVPTVTADDLQHRRAVTAAWAMARRPFTPGRAPR